MSENGIPEKVVTTSNVDLSIGALMELVQKSPPAPKAKRDTIPHWFIRRTRAGGHEYQQLCRHVYTPKGRRLQVAKVVWPEE